MVFSGLAFVYFFLVFSFCLTLTKAGFPLKTNTTTKGESPHPKILLKFALTRQKAS